MTQSKVLQTLAKLYSLIEHLLHQFIAFHVNV